MRPVRVAALTVALLVLPATAAGAHPSLNPNEVPVGAPVATVLVVPHGCSTGSAVRPEDGGEAVPTVRFDLQLVDGVTVEPEPVEGWDVTDDGEAIVWTDAGGATTDPIEFPATLTVAEGAPGDTVELAAYQECEDGSSYRWAPGAEDTPPVRLELTEGAGTAVPDATATATEASPNTTATQSPTAATDTPTDAVAPTTEPAEDATVGAAAIEEEGPSAAAIAAFVALFAVLAGVGLWLRRRGRA